ncbi:MAG: DUF424 family protein [Candidatus Lokiarchaeota archaeon]|nr:DUF424 family protein [Candidatus Lokiarchaeota archaeon]
MNVYIKVHYKNDIEIIAICDENLLCKVFQEGNLRIEISNHFFGGDLIQIDKAIAILKQVSYFNIIGESIVQEAINNKILNKEGIRYINGVPMALKMMF